MSEQGTPQVLESPQGSEGPESAPSVASEGPRTTCNYLSRIPTSALANIISLSEESVRKVLRTMPEFHEAFVEDARVSAHIAAQARLLLEPEGGDRHLVAVNKWVRSQVYTLTNKFAYRASGYAMFALEEKTNAWADAAIATAKSLDPYCIVGKHHAFVSDLDEPDYSRTDDVDEDSEEYVKCVSVQFGPYVCLVEFDDCDVLGEYFTWSTRLDVYYLSSSPSSWCFAASSVSRYAHHGNLYSLKSCLQQVGNTPLEALEDQVRMTALALAACIGRWCPLSHLVLLQKKNINKKNRRSSPNCPVLVEHVARALHSAGVYVEDFGAHVVPFKDEFSKGCPASTFDRRVSTIRAT